MGKSKTKSNQYGYNIIKALKIDKRKKWVMNIP